MEPISKFTNYYHISQFVTKDAQINLVEGFGEVKVYTVYIFTIHQETQALCHNVPGAGEKKDLLFLNQCWAGKDSASDGYFLTILSIVLMMWDVRETGRKLAGFDLVYALSSLQLFLQTFVDAGPLILDKTSAQLCSS